MKRVMKKMSKGLILYTQRMMRISTMIGKATTLKSKGSLSLSSTIFKYRGSSVKGIVMCLIVFKSYITTCYCQPKQIKTSDYHPNSNTIIMMKFFMMIVMKL